MGGYALGVFLVRVPITFGLGLLARKGAERVTGSALARMDGVPGNEKPDAADLNVKLRYILVAVAIESAVFAITKALADRGAEKAALALTGRSAHGNRDDR